MCLLCFASLPTEKFDIGITGTGLHASISIHICDDYLDQTTGNWVCLAHPNSAQTTHTCAFQQGPNLECFITRIGQHPERLQNVYFAYVLSLRALERGGRHLQRALDEYSADDSAKIAFQSLLTSSECPGTFDETSMFSGPSANVSEGFYFCQVQQSC